MRSFLLLGPGLLDAKVLAFCSVGVAFSWNMSDSPKTCINLAPTPRLWRLFHRRESFARPHIRCHLPRVFFFVIFAGDECKLRKPHCLFAWVVFLPMECSCLGFIS